MPVRDLEPSVDLVHPPQRPPPELAVPAVLRERADQKVGAVVALLAAADELTGRIEQRGDARHRERLEERELERPGGVERELSWNLSRNTIRRQSRTGSSVRISRSHTESCTRRTLAGVVARVQRVRVVRMPKEETKEERLDRELEELVQELRLALPGVQSGW